jgi:hypothetical protein
MRMCVYYIWNALIYENGKLHLYRDVKHVRYLFCKILKMNKLWINLGLEKWRTQVLRRVMSAPAPHVTPVMLLLNDTNII